MMLTLHAQIVHVEEGCGSEFSHIHSDHNHVEHFFITSIKCDEGVKIWQSKITMVVHKRSIQKPIILIFVISTSICFVDWDDTFDLKS